jgi:hypothetical protein
MMLTVERLRQVLDYDPDTGIFKWKVATAHRTLVGEEAGSINKNGYRMICVDAFRYRSHRLAWLYVHGSWPSEFVDHRNGNKLDNRIENLREADKRQNAQNSRRPSNNTSGFKGVTYDRARDKWIAQIKTSSGHRSIGRFETAEEAGAAYALAAEKAFGEFARVA